MRMQFLNKDQFVYTAGVTHYDDSQTGLTYYAVQTSTSSGTPPVVTTVTNWYEWGTPGNYPQVPNVFQGNKTAAQQGTTAVTVRTVT